MDMLSTLNAQQRAAVTASPGPTLVLAGPGSGKTRVLVHRIAYLVSHLGVPPRSIMAVTFTNKAAREMKTRVETLLEGHLRGLTIGTFHSICARLLRRESAHLAVTADFVIYDEADQLALVKQVVRELNLNDKQYTPGRMLNKISAAKNELIGPQEYAASTYLDEIAKRVYTRYQQLLALNNAFDFDDLLMEVVRLFDTHPEVLAKYQRAYEHILVDEFQDTNTAQYSLLRQLARGHRNLYCVGDPDQCFPADTPVLTETGPRPIEQIRVGERVIAASGRGATLPAEVRHIESRAYQGDLVKVVTCSGRSVRATPNHIVFARLGTDPHSHLVYLMQREGLGFRLGLTTGARSDGESPELQTGLKVRSNQEHCERVWVLRVCRERAEAAYWEEYYAFQYGIPTTVFHANGRGMRFTPDMIRRLYASIDTRERAERLLGDLGMDIRYPHHVPRARQLRQAVNLRYFGDQRRTVKTPWNAHRASVISGDPDLRQRLQAFGNSLRKGKRHTWRVEFSRLHYDDIQALARQLSEQGDGLPIVTGAFLVAPTGGMPARRFSLMPASHLHPTMIVAIETDGQVVVDEILSVERERYAGQIYDLEIADLRNYVAGGMVVHNSIYRWRGADYRNVHRFQDDYPDALTLLLEENYRSTQLILDAAMAVIDRHPGRTRKQLFTERQGGVQIYGHEAYNDQDEAQFVLDKIDELVRRRDYQPGDCAVMYRTNAQSRVVEEAFIRAGRPYRLVGAQRFYGRKEIKDLLAYLRLIHNPADTISLMRVINTPPRGLGARTLEQLLASANAAEISPSELVQDLGENGSKSRLADAFTGKAGAALAYFGRQLAEWRAAAADLTVAQLMGLVLDNTGYADYVNDGSEDGMERWGNVLELRSVAEENPEAGLGEFLEQVALVSDQDTLVEEDQAPTLLTLHAAKGLEFPVVFILGLDEGVLPHQRSFDDPEAMHEERRLMYVGMTRAKDRLYLLRAFRRSHYGDSGVAEASRFLDDIPQELVTGNLSRKQARAEAYFKKATRWDSGSSAADSRPVTRYRSGQRVRHAQFGEGMVIDSRIIGGDEEVDVAFEAVGLKRLAASLAKLDILPG